MRANAEIKMAEGNNFHDLETLENDVNLSDWMPNGTFLEDNASTEVSEIDNENFSSDNNSKIIIRNIPSESVVIPVGNISSGSSNANFTMSIKSEIDECDHLEDFKVETSEPRMIANEENNCVKSDTKSSDNDCCIVANYKQVIPVQPEERKSSNSESNNSFIEFVDLTEDDPEETKFQDSFADNFTKDTRLCILRDVLLDADPNYLEKKVNEFKTDEELQWFVLTALEKQNYPKRDFDKNVFSKKTGENTGSDSTLIEEVSRHHSENSNVKQSFINNFHIDNLRYTDFRKSDAIADEKGVEIFEPPHVVHLSSHTVTSSTAARTVITYAPAFTTTSFATSRREASSGQYAQTCAKPHTVTSQELTNDHTSHAIPQTITSTSLTNSFSMFPDLLPEGAVTSQEANRRLATHRATNIPPHTAVTATQTDDTNDQPLNLTLTVPTLPITAPLQVVTPNTRVPSATWVGVTTLPTGNFPPASLMYQNAHVWLPCRLHMNTLNPANPRRNYVPRGRRLLDHRRRRRLGILDAATLQLEDLLESLNDSEKTNEVEDQRYNLLADTLIWADQEFLRKEANNLKDDNDIEKFLICAIANEETWNKCVTADNPAQRALSGLADCKYKILLELLPDASPTFLKRESAKLNSDEEVHEFAMKLSREQNYPKRKANSPQNKSNKRKNEVSDPEPVDPKYQALLDMLPDADPDFLLQKSQLLGSEDDLQTFVLKAVEDNTYPKRDQFLERQEYNKQWKKYIENFNVKEFLRVIPNPVKFFYIDKVNSKNPLDMPSNFLQHRYRRKGSQDFKVFYRAAKQNLTKTCDILDLHFQIKPRKYGAWDQKTIFSTSVLQEIAFIQNKKEIAHYLLFKEKRKSEAYEKAKLEGTLQECSCCYDEQLSEDMASCFAGHVFCLSCIKRGSEVVIGNGGTKFPCYSDGCKEEFSFDILKNVLNSEVFSRLLIRKQYEEVNAAGIPGLETCSFCEFCSIPPAEDKLFRCLNPSCMKITCRSCKKIDHLPLSCDEFKQKMTRQKMQSYVEDKMTEALVRTCWQCGTKFVKENGCNMMQCKCGAKMCYFCRKPVQDYNHFASGRCGQFLDTTAHDEAAVRHVGKRAKREMEAANPGYSLPNDPTVLRKNGSYHH